MAVVHLLDSILALFGNLIGSSLPKRAGKWFAALVFITVVVVIAALSQI
jgi:hypothetical protein